MAAVLTDTQRDILEQQEQWDEEAIEAGNRWAAEPVVVAINLIRADRFNPQVLQRILTALSAKVAATWGNTEMGEVTLNCLDNLHDDLEGAKT